MTAEWCANHSFIGFDVLSDFKLFENHFASFTPKTLADVRPGWQLAYTADTVPVRWSNMVPGAVYTIDKFSMILIDQYTTCLQFFSWFLELSFPRAFLLSQQVRKSQTDKASARLILRMAQITATPLECHQFKYRGRRPPFTTAYGRDIRTGATPKGWLWLKYAFCSKLSPMT